MKHDAIARVNVDEPIDLPTVMERVASISSRPRYTLVVLNLINSIANDKGRAGPWIESGDALVSVREWLCDAITPMAARNHKRVALAEQVRMTMLTEKRYPSDPADADRAIDDEVRERVRTSGLTGVSRAVTELVKAGLLTRHYQGFRVDHENRGAQRHAVYSIPANVRAALTGGARLV